MPTKVLDIEFDMIPDIIDDLAEYQRAMVLVRIGGRPVDRVYVTIEQGIIQGEQLRSAIISNAGRVFWELWLRKIIALPEKVERDDRLPELTIAVCTRDRPDDLLHCLESLARVYNQPQEILVIDSCSSRPDTYEVVKKFLSVRYIREEVPGLDRARNRAIREAQNEIVAFIDDDAFPDPGWLPALAQNFRHPNVACVTGLTMPGELETVAQEAFEEYSTFSRGFEHLVYEWSNIHPIGAGQIGVGNNMAVRRAAAEQVGLFDEALDAGTPTCSGGDAEMFSRFISAGYRIMYEPKALVWHRHRRTWKELRRTIYGYGVGIYAFWARKFLLERVWYVAPVALKWLFFEQLPRLLRALFRIKGAPPLDLIWLEICGCFSGPWLYYKSRRQNDQIIGSQS